MTKKFLAVTLVLVLAAGFMAVAQEDERPLTGEWENTLTLAPNQAAYYHPADNPLRFSSDLSLTYSMGGLTYDAEASFGYDMRKYQTQTLFDKTDDTVPGDVWGAPYSVDNGLTDMEFGVSTTVGLLDLSGTVNFATQTPGLDYMTSQASLTLGGVSITDTFVLQPVMEGTTTSTYTYWKNNSTNDVTDDEYTYYTPTDELGAGMDITFSGETPGGVSVEVSNLFGMESVVDFGDYPYSSLTKTGTVSGKVFGSGEIPHTTGYNIVTEHDPANSQTPSYGGSSMQYVSTTLTLDNMSIGCCDFSSETMFSEANGFEYTLFEFTVESSSMPLVLDGDLKFTAQTKSVSLEPSFETDWACFEVYTDLVAGSTQTPYDELSNNGTKVSVLDAFEIEGFAITGVKLGHVEFSSYTALGDNMLIDIAGTKFGYNGYYYDEVIRIEKLEEYPLDFTLDTFFDMTESGALFDLGLFSGSMEYKLDEEFTVGTGLSIKPNAGLQSFDFTFDYSF